MTSRLLGRSARMTDEMAITHTVRLVQVSSFQRLSSHSNIEISHTWFPLAYPKWNNNMLHTILDSSRLFRQIFTGCQSDATLIGWLLWQASGGNRRGILKIQFCFFNINFYSRVLQRNVWYYFCNLLWWPIQNYSWPKINPLI